MKNLRRFVLTLSVLLCCTYNIMAQQDSTKLDDFDQLIRIGAICQDDTQSYSTGTGTCAQHGGVKHWLYASKNAYAKAAGYLPAIASNDLVKFTPRELEIIKALDGDLKTFRKGKAQEQANALAEREAQQEEDWRKSNDRFFQTLLHGVILFLVLLLLLIVTYVVVRKVI